MVDFLTTVVLGGIAYDILKVSGKITLDNLKMRLKAWLLDDSDLNAIAQTVNRAPENAKESAKNLEAFLEESPIIREILSQAKSTKINVGDRIKTEGDNSPGKVGGDYVIGDKIGGDKNIYHHEAPKPGSPIKILKRLLAVFIKLRSSGNTKDKKWRREQADKVKDMAEQIKFDFPDRIQTTLNAMVTDADSMVYHGTEIASGHVEIGQTIQRADDSIATIKSYIERELRSG